MKVPYWSMCFGAPILQEVAIASQHPWLLRKVCASTVYKRASNIPAMLHFAGTVEACQLLLREGYHVNNTNHAFQVTPLHCASTREVAEFLISAGADVARLATDGDFMPKVQVIRWILRVRPDMQSIFLPPLLSKDVIDPILDVVRLLSDYHFVIPPAKFARARDPELVCVLCSFGYISEIPMGTKVEPEWLLWRPRTHRYFEDVHLRARVWCALLVMRRGCARLPNDLRAHLLVLAMN
jgi:hypothetical protein